MISLVCRERNELNTDLVWWPMVGRITHEPWICQSPQPFSPLCPKPTMGLLHQLSTYQIDLYIYFIGSPDIISILKANGSQSLKASGLLKKLCNQSDLLNISEHLPGRESWFLDDCILKGDRRRDSKVEVWYSGKKWYWTEYRKNPVGD